MSKKSSTFAPAFEKRQGAIAQLVEQRTENPCVPSSILGGTTENDLMRAVFWCPSEKRTIYSKGPPQIFDFWGERSAVRKHYTNDLS